MEYILRILAKVVIYFFLGVSITAQNDTVLKSDGEEMIGTVTSINENDVRFIYQKESLEYSIKKSDILKITFASGRIQYFNEQKLDTPNQLEDHHNRVAILPFGYIKDQETSNIEMTKKIQLETYSIFKRKATILQYQDPSTTNALLAKAGVTDNLQGYTMGEICNILGVEYLVQGLVSIERSSITNYSNEQSTTTGKNKAYIDRKGNIIGSPNQKVKSNTTSFSTSTQNYSTNITMNVYTDKGENVFNMDHDSFWQTQDAYKITLQYLAKRSPLYKR